MLAVAGGKGGCGKTTTTLGLAGALARQRAPVLAVDADREMPDLHAMAEVARRPCLDAVAAGWPAGLVAGAASAPGVPAGVSVLPAAETGIETRPADAPGATELARLRGESSTVLVDSPAGAGPDAVAPLRVVDAALVVTTPEPACLRDAAKTAAMARELDTPIAGAVVSRAGESGSDAVDPRAPPGVEDLLDCEVLGVVPTADCRPDADPLDDAGVRAAHDRLVSALQPKYL
ncbi:MinD/ParA family ATP-binding protein [Halorussus marinus]|uniref:MinD/ParA family ATP-binding protein n=1 Tax=Halorussus marinus TaxID=2505976 RepID=UPI00106E51F9|nr:P-loop NTPase [Halorussus marinus]